jgi:Mn-dependent DtxR family transcriptional regulator
MTLEKLSGMLNPRIPAGEELLLGLEKKGYIEMKPIDGSDDRMVELTELGRKEAPNSRT